MSASDWIGAYEHAWRAGDAEAAGALYAEDCVFRSSPFREREDARAYMVRVFAEARSREVWFGRPIEDADRAAIEYWALLVDPEDSEFTLAGCHVVRFREDGLVSKAHDYWHMEAGHRPPPPGWGR